MRLLLPLLLLPSIVLADSSQPYNMLAPIFGIPSISSIGQYLDLIFKGLVGIAALLAVVMLVVCGIKMMTSEALTSKSESRECIKNAILGLLLALAAWIILNTINPELVKTQLGIIIPPAASTDNLPPVAQTPRQSLPGRPAPSPTTPPPPTTGAACPMSSINFCNQQSRMCTNSQCPKYAALAQQYGQQFGVDVNLIKAIIMQESSCGIKTVGPMVTMKNGSKQQACGPMQMVESTANQRRAACGIPSSTRMTCSYLVDPANLDKVICMGVAELSVLQRSSCGSDGTRGVAAGYNGGSGVCSLSNDCNSDVSCDGGGVTKWECLYDNPSHTQCNKTYDETRKYAMQVSYCQQNP